MRALRIAFLTALVLGTGACTGLGDSMVVKEAPPSDDDSYLQRVGPPSHVDLGGGEEQLLTRFQKVLDEKIRLAAREKELLDEIAALRKHVEEEGAAKDEEREMRAAAEAEAERLRIVKCERETKILHLQMQIADLQRTKLQLEIADVERQLETLVQETGAPAGPLGR